MTPTSCYRAGISKFMGVKKPDLIYFIGSRIVGFAFSPS